MMPPITGGVCQKAVRIGRIESGKNKLHSNGAIALFSKPSLSALEGAWLKNAKESRHAILRRSFPARVFPCSGDGNASVCWRTVS